MLNADRRGEIAATEDAQQQIRVLPLKAVSLLARAAFATMQTNGDAYIEPEEDFVQGYVNQFCVCQSIRFPHLEMNADPFFEEMPRTLFVLFQAFPGVNTLELHLDETGAGSLWTKGEHARCILEWADFNEGLRCLLSRKRTVMEAAS